MSNSGVSNRGVGRYRSPAPGEIVVVKVGGSTLGEGDSTSPDIVELARRGLKLVVVHGGGAVISEWVKRLGIQPEFVRGLRRTDPETLNVAIAVLCGLVNAQLVVDLNGLDGRAIGFSGVSGGMLKARVLSEDLGLVGEIVEVDPAPIHAALDAGMIPVIAPAATNIEAAGAGDAILNINADTSAGHIARRLGAAQMIFQTDVAGVLDVNRRLIPRMTKRQAGDLVASGIAGGGMIPKIEACIMALETARTGHIIDGRAAGALIACVEGRDVGTRIV
jgi:acetylglutamate kinase